MDTSFCTPYDSSLLSPMMITLGRSRTGLGPNQRKSLTEKCFWKKENPNKNPKGVMPFEHYISELGNFRKKNSLNIFTPFLIL